MSVYMPAYLCVNFACVYCECVHELILYIYMCVCVCELIVLACMCVYMISVHAIRLFD